MLDKLLRFLRRILKIQSPSRLHSTDYARINRDYMEGYNRGYDAGVREGLYRKYTPNQLRDILLGLHPIKENGGVK